MVIVQSDVPAQVIGQPFLSDQVDLGSGILVYQLKVGLGGGPNPVTQGTVPWIVAGLPGLVTDKSGTLTLANTAQTIAVANATRRYLYIQNMSTIDSLWVNLGVVAVQSQPSFELFPGAAFVMENNFISSQFVSIIGPTTGQPWSAKEG